MSEKSDRLRFQSEKSSKFPVWRKKGHRKFKGANRSQLSLLPPSIEDWLPEDHLARFVVESVSSLFYGYATGVYSSRKLEAASYSVALKGFDQCYNAQAAVSNDMLVVGLHVSEYPNDQQQYPNPRCDR